MSLELKTFIIQTECLATTKTETTYGPTSSMATARDVTAKGHRTGGKTSLQEGSLERVSDWSFKSEQHAEVRSRW